MYKVIKVDDGRGYEAAAVVPAEAEVKAAVVRARGGDVGPLRSLLREHECLVGVLGGDLPGLVIARLVERGSGADPAAREALNARAARLRRELSAGGDSAAERMLVESAVAAWLLLWILTLAENAKELSLGLHDHLGRQAARAQRRLEGALKSLAALRRLLPRQAASLNDEPVRPRLAAANPPRTAH